MVCGDWFCTNCVGSQSGADIWLQRKRLHRECTWLTVSGPRPLAFRVGSFVGVYYPGKPAKVYVGRVTAIDATAGISLHNWSLWAEPPASKAYVYVEDPPGIEDWREPRQYWRLIKPLFDVRLGEQMVGTPPTARRSLTLSRQVEQGRVSGYLQAFHL